MADSDETRTRDADFAALWSSDGVTRSFASTPSGLPAELPFLFSAGQHFGPYLIVRPIGKGGMGQVYEAEETESGRRIALKLLSRGLGDDEERERFLREGQLAASLSHPNCVYVFGTSEIQGFPIIVMELVPEGTLKDLVVPDSPMTPARAVDAILQVIAGLEAAAAIGILHRDVKPSNCFVHREGRVVVGDFGLSVAASGHGPSETGTILGTPGFASPEQLRGGSLDVRSDIYSVGATLFYLLAGRAPFDDRTTTNLIARVASEPPPVLADLRQDLPRGFSAVVARCLAKSPSDRFPTYAALRAELEPYSSARPAPAPILRRALAGWADSYVTGIPALVITSLFGLFPLGPSHRVDAAIVGITTAITIAAYYGVLEGHWGASIGKALFGLRVVDAAQATPGIPRAIARALVFGLPTQVVVQAITWIVVRRIPDFSVGLLDTLTGGVCLLLLFCTARPSNGYLGLHDRWTRTRVVKRRVRVEARERIDRPAAEAHAPFEGGVLVGPYLVAGDVLPPVASPACVVGFDERLERRVWIELLPPGTPALPALRRDLDRPTRARWLGGRRDGAECWDAYEAVPGLPLGDVTASPQRWTRARHWLGDLAHEVAAGLADGSLPPLDADRVWIGHDDRARILEWSHPGAGGGPPAAGGLPPDLPSAQRLLYGVTTGALLGAPAGTAQDLPPRVPLPMPARRTLLSLRNAAFSTPSALVDAVTSALAVPAVLPRGRRAWQVAASAAFPVLIVVFSVGAVVALNSKKAGSREMLTLMACLDAIEQGEKASSAGRERDQQAQQLKNDAEIYLAEHLSGLIEDPATWSQSFPNVGERGGRARARRALESHRARTPEEVRHADDAVGRMMEGESASFARIATFTGLWGIAITVGTGSCVVTILLSLLGALVTGSGFTFRPCGVALVNRRGEPASRLRALWRAAVTWAPAMALLVSLKFNPKAPDYDVRVLLLQTSIVAGFAAAALWAIARPTRGVQDRLAGTWLVPR